MALKTGDVDAREDYKKEASAKHWASYSGDCPCINRILASRSSRLWTVFKFLNALFRAFGQVIFCNNPISGIFVLIAVLVAEPYAALGGILSATTAIITALLLEQPKEEVASGRTACNSALLGFVTVALAQAPGFAIYLEAKLWVSIIFASVFCVYVTIALSSLLYSLPRLRLPCLQAPFVITQTLLLFCLLHSAYPDVHHPHIVEPEEPGELVNLTTTIPESVTLSENFSSLSDMFEQLNELQGNDTGELNPAIEGIGYEGHHIAGGLNWGEVLAGVILSTSKVLSMHSVPSAVLLYLSILIFSPLSASFALIGAIISTIAGVMFSEGPESYAAVYEGSWGCQGLLCAMVIGGIYYVLTWQSAVAASACSFFAAVVRHFIGDPEFIPPRHDLPSRLPLLTLPFVLSALLFLCLTSVGDGFLHPSHLSSPEQQYVDYRETYGKCIKGKKGRWSSIDSSQHSSHEVKCPLAEPEEV
ncbi:urea transporter 1-like [Hetaerina americana]|uniref:urea transporter 1-like n=1 Tax=Hetaerina americana TaxID=62018 RepID=UPI003A7F48E5